MQSPVEVIYHSILRPLLFRLDPETAHDLTLALLAGVPVLPCPTDPPELRSTIWNIAFANPIGLAAGMDKDIRAVGAWQTMGFGFAELGTITPRPQPGNPAPRMWRVPEHRALVNRLGFPSAGAEAAAARLARVRRSGVRIKLGLNFGPNKETPASQVPDDCVALMSRLGALADFIVINLSSPNTPGLRDWQTPSAMRELFSAILAARAEQAIRPPVLVKLAPDLNDAALEEICATVVDLKLDGIVAVNSTIARDGVEAAARYDGGLTGAPLEMRAREVIREIYRHTRGALPIVGVGGIASAESAYEHIRAGASLVELYTGLVYEGPGLIAAIKAGLIRLLARDGLRSISDAVGAGA